MGYACGDDINIFYSRVVSTLARLNVPATLPFGSYGGVGGGGGGGGGGWRVVRTEAGTILEVTGIDGGGVGGGDGGGGGSNGGGGAPVEATVRRDESRPEQEMCGIINLTA